MSRASRWADVRISCPLGGKWDVTSEPRVGLRGGLSWSNRAANRFVLHSHPLLLPHQGSILCSERRFKHQREGPGPIGLHKYKCVANSGLKLYLNSLPRYSCTLLLGLRLYLHTGALANGPAPRLSRHSAWLQSLIQSVGARGIIRLDELRSSWPA